MKKLMWGLMAVLVSMAFFGAAFADSVIEDTADAVYQRAAQSETSFADPDGYKRQIPYQGTGGDGASGDAGAGASGGGDSGGNSGDSCGDK